MSSLLIVLMTTSLSHVNYEKLAHVRQLSMQHLLLEVLDYDRGKKDDFIGLTSLPIDDLIKSYESRADKGLPFTARSHRREREP